MTSEEPQDGAARPYSAERRTPRRHKRVVVQGTERFDADGVKLEPSDVRTREQRRSRCRRMMRYACSPPRTRGRSSPCREGHSHDRAHVCLCSGAGAQARVGTGYARSSNTPQCGGSSPRMRRSSSAACCSRVQPRPDASNVLIGDLADRIRERGLNVAVDYGLDNGMRLPMVVGAKDKPYTLAVFTDDAQFMGIQSTRERHRILQQEMGALGWSVMTIWSVAGLRLNRLLVAQALRPLQHGLEHLGARVVQSAHSAAGDGRPRLVGHDHLERGRVRQPGERG